MTYTPPPGPTPGHNEYQLGTGQTAPNGRWPNDLPKLWPLSQLKAMGGPGLSPRAKRIIWTFVAVFAAWFVLVLLIPLAIYG
jgi:hypothetical protein